MVGGVLFGIYKEDIHHGLERGIGQDLFRGDSMHIGGLDYASTLLLSPQLELEDIKIWGQGAKHMKPAFDVQLMEITLSWHEILMMLWDASDWSWSRPWVNLRNENIRVRLNGMKITNSILIMTRTAEGHNHRLFRPPMEKIEKFATGELKMAGGFRIRKFEANNFTLKYFKDRSGNPDEALPKVYDVQLDYLSMDMSSDPERTYFHDFYTEGMIHAIRVKDNEGLVGRTFKADGDAELIKLSIAQKLNNDTGFDLVSENFNVTFKGLTATAKGTLSTLNERMRMNIDFQSKTGVGDRKNEALLSFLELTLSERFLDVIKSYDPLGELTFVGKVFNRNNEYGGPIKIDLDYTASQTSFQFRFFENGKSHRISDLELSGEFEVGGDSPSYITADITNGELYDGQPFQGHVVLDNVFRREFMDSLQQLAQPPLAEVQFESNQVDFRRLLEFLEFEDYEEARGSIDFRDFHFSGPITSLTNSYADMNYGGELRFRDLLFEVAPADLPIPIRIEQTNGGIVFAKNSVKPRLDLTFNQYPISVQKGTIRDFVPYLFNEDRDRLALEDFELRIDSVEVNTLLDELKTLAENANGTPSMDSRIVANLIDEAIKDLLIKDLQVSVPKVFANELYELEGVEGRFPLIDPVHLTAQINIDQGMKLHLTHQIGPDTIAVDLEAFTAGEKVRLSTRLGLYITDINDFGCKTGFEVPLGTHLEHPLSLDATLGLTTNWEGKDVDLVLSGTDSRLFSDELGIDLSLAEMTLKSRLEDFRPVSDLDLDIAAALDDELLHLEIEVYRDSLFIFTPSEQSLEFATAKKYLSLICEIDQNLERIQNLEGSMTFETSLKEPIQESMFDLITQANQVGTFGLTGLSFDFLKGNDVISFENIDGAIRYNEAAVYIDQFKGNYGDSDFEIYGTQLEDIIGFILLGDPLVIDTLHLKSELLDLTSILESANEFQYACDEQDNTAFVSAINCDGCLKRNVTTDTLSTAEPIAFSLINFLQTSKVRYADAYMERILFRPISGSEPFEIDNLNTSVLLDSSMLTLTDLQARMYDGLIFQYKPLEVWVKNIDTIAVSGAYTVRDLELHEVIANLNSPSVEVLKSDQLDFRGKLFMDFDFVDTLTSATDLNNLEFRINNMQVTEGSAKELTLIGMDDKWKANVGPVKRFLAGLFLGSFQKKFERPTEYVVNLENLVLDTGWINIDIMEFYNNQFNLVATGSYEMETGKRNIDLLLQRPVKKYDYNQYLSTFCKKGFLTYFNVTEDQENTTLISPGVEEQNQRDASFQRCLDQCPCEEADCVTTCLEQNPILTEYREVPNQIKFKLGNKRIKEVCD